MGRVIMTRAAIAAHLQAHGLRIDAAAQALGISADTLRQRMRRHGVRRDALVLLRHGVTLPPTEGDAVLSPDGESVRLTLGDYATLQTQAAQGREAERLSRELSRAERIIASLTRSLETVGRTAMAAVLLVLLAVAPVAAQYTPEQLRDLQATVLATGEQVKRDYPEAWRNAHATGEPQGSEFVRRWALTLRAGKNITACVNGKRGTDTLSQDVLVFPVTSGGNRDTSGQYAQIAIIDVIAGAGGPSPTLGWGDVSAVSQGKCITPVLEAHEGGSTPTPGPGPGLPVTPAPTVDLRPVLDALARVEARLAALEARPTPAPDLAALEAYIDAMVGSGPAGDPATLPNHITDIKQRLDVIRVAVEQLTAWLRSRAVLRY